MYKCWLPDPDNRQNLLRRFAFSLLQPLIATQRPFPRRPKTPVRSAIDVAFEFQRLLDEKMVNNRAELAERYGISRARVTQVMNLLRLPSAVLSLLAESGGATWSERQLRGLLTLSSQEDQVAAVRAMGSRPMQKDS